MKLQLNEYTCGNCGVTFDAPGFGEQGSYGEFILRTSRGTLAYLNAIKDLTYKEVSDLLPRIRSLASLRPLELATYLRRVFGSAACDWADGVPFEIEAYPPCPNCHSQTVTAWRSKKPPVWVDIDVPAVTHREWSKLTEAQKIERLKTQLSLP